MTSNDSRNRPQPSGLRSGRPKDDRSWDVPVRTGASLPRCLSANSVGRTEGTLSLLSQPLPMDSHVDHFIPWSRYPADLGNIFVLAHNECYNAKLDYLAAEHHLVAWIKRNGDHQVELQRGWSLLRCRAV
jgi:5-methylcytosine-specific restriction endonuclease McrA